MPKVHNAPAALPVKLELRRWVLQEISPAHVFDAYCGPGEMWRGAWKDAASYVGCDECEWSVATPFSRFVGDTVAVMRAVRLEDYNVFDIDAFGCPFGAAMALARRKWRRQEMCAVVFTDGSSIKTRFGQLPAAQLELGGVPMRGKGNVKQRHQWMVRAWAKRSGLDVLRLRLAEGNGSGRSSQAMVYSAAIVRGAA